MSEQLLVHCIMPFCTCSLLVHHICIRLERIDDDDDDCDVLAALSCYRLSHRDSTFVNWIAEQHLHD